MPLNFQTQCISGAFLLTALSILAAGTVEAVERYVAPAGGVTSGQGTLAQPWTLRKALASSLAGDVVYLRGGTYSDTFLAGSYGVYTLGVSGASGAPITFQAYPGETPVLDGTAAGPGIPNTASSYALLLIASRSHVIFRDLEIRNLRTTNRSDAMGILVTGTSHHVEIRNCKIHHIETALATEAGNEGVANGIGVYGENAAVSLNNLIIDGCEVHSLKTGSSESVVCNGNVDTFQITNNVIRDCNNIGIDCIGWEGISPGALDYARNGIVRGNTVYNIDSQFNPAYGAVGATPGERSAPGIYVDGGASILIEQNRVYSCNFGVSLGSENTGRVTANCTLRDNLVWSCHIAGLVMGGSGVNNGGASGNTIRHNTFFQNDTDPRPNFQLGEITLQHRLTGNSITHNILYPSAKNIFITNWVTIAGSSGNVIDRNLYYSPSGAAAAADSQWAWDENYVEGFSNWRLASGADANSFFGSPQFANAGANPPDLRLLSTSAARNAGDPAFAPAGGEVDAWLQPRLAENRVDIGAYEFPAPTVTIAATDADAGEWGANTGTLTLTRSGSTASPLTVTVVISGTAAGGADFASIASTVGFAANAATAAVTVTPVLDAAAEGPETVTVTISSSPGGAYVVGAPSAATVTIADRPLDQWRLDQFGANAGNPAIAGDDADPDRDTLTNLMEYALGAPPNTSSTGALPAVSLENGCVAITAAKNSSAVDVVFSARVGGSPGPWETGPAHVTIVTNSATVFKARDKTAASSAARRFIQMVVTK